MTLLTWFKAYDIRGRLGIDLDENIAYRIGAAIAVALQAKTIVLGRDVRAYSEVFRSHYFEQERNPVVRVEALNFGNSLSQRAWVDLY